MMNSQIARCRDRLAASQARVILMAFALALALPLLGAAVLWSAPQPTSAAAATPTPCPPATPVAGQETPKLCVEIGEHDIYFDPNLITIPADTPVRIVLTNHGVAPHDFSITDHLNTGLKNLNISILTQPGKSSETTINAPEGTYYFFCNQPGHEAAGMRGYLTVKKDAQITTAEATVTPRAG